MLSEIKLELKEVKEQIEQIQTKLDIFEQQNQDKKKLKQKTKITPDKKDKRDWNYPAKMK